MSERGFPCPLIDCCRDMSQMIVRLLLIATALLVKSMTRHLNRVPRSFDPVDDEPRVVVPDSPARTGRAAAGA